MSKRFGVELGIDEFTQPVFGKLHLCLVRARKLAELPEKAQVILEKQAQIIHAVTQHRQAVQPHAKRKAGITLGINAAKAQYLRMHHAAAGEIGRASCREREWIW